ncbi:MAG TPA: GNAT family N-acetyltransferase [Ilumatobacteraceae bacterium]
MLVHEIDADAAESRIVELVAVLRDSVDNGASVNFLAGMTDVDGVAFWRASIAEQRDGHRCLVVAELDGSIIGTAMLLLAPQQNQQHRADVAKMLVHSAYRRRGIGAALLAAIESTARAHRRTLLMLDTEKDSAGELLYTTHGWVRYGEVPGHAHRTDGTPWPTSFFYKQLT